MQAIYKCSSRSVAEQWAQTSNRYQNIHKTTLQRDFTGFVFSSDEKKKQIHIIQLHQHNINRTVSLAQSNESHEISNSAHSNVSRITYTFVIIKS